MGVFNEQSLNHPFAKGIQGAPGVGFNLTSDGDYDMVNKKLRNVGAPSVNTDAATKKYVDDNSTGTPSTSRLTVDSNIDMKDQYRILNLKHPLDADEPATKQYSDSRFLDRNGSRTMIGNLSMNNNKIIKLGTPTANDDAATKKYVDDNSTRTSSRLTIDSNIDMRDRYRITNLVTPQDSKDPATKYYVDNTFLDTDGSYPMKGNLNMANNRIINLPAPLGPKQPTPLAYTDLKYLHVGGTNKMTNNLNMDNKKIINLRPPTDSTDAATKKYVDDSTPDLSDYLEKDGSVAMTGSLKMNQNKIINVATPTSNTDATTKQYVDSSISTAVVGVAGRIPDTSDFLKKDGSVLMTGNLNLGNKKIVGLATPTLNTDAATKKYVDDNTGSPDLTNYLKKDGSVAMTGELNGGGNKIINISKPLQNSDAATKDYVDKLVHHTAVQPSHYNNQFAFLMSSGSQWTDESENGGSFILSKIADLAPNKGNFHNYNHKVIYLNVIKNIFNKFNIKMEVNFSRLTDGFDYTLCFEILNENKNLWENTIINVDKGTSKGLSIGNVNIIKLTHMYTDSTGKTKTMYYHRIIINFRKLALNIKYFLHITINLRTPGSSFKLYPRQISGIYIITYGITGTFSNIDPDKVYDYHTAFDIKPTEVVYNVDLNANFNSIKNIAYNRNDDNSAATVGALKNLTPFTENNLYRKYFEEVYDFSDADSYGINIDSSGVIINSINPNLTFPANIDLSKIKEKKLNINGYELTLDPFYSNENTLCLVFSHLMTRGFLIKKYNSNNNSNLYTLDYNRVRKNLTLTVGNNNISIPVISSLSGKEIVLWISESNYNGVTKVNFSNYSLSLTLNHTSNNPNQKYKFKFDNADIKRIMYSPNFYDIGSEQYHKVMLQEKLNGSYIM